MLNKYIQKYIKEVQDAYYTAEPRMVYPEETGIDFAESIETSKETNRS